MNYKIIPVKMGNSANPFDMSNFIKGHPIGTESYHMPYAFFIIKNEDNGECFMVDTGCSLTEENIKEQREELINEVTFEEGLAAWGLKPEDIKTVFMTHLHWDHSWNMDKLPNATFYVQKKELYHAVYPLPHELRTYCFTGIEGFKQPKWPKVIDCISVVDGDTEIMPGIRLVLTPGHTHGSQSVLVETNEGLYAITGDFCYVKQNWIDGIAINNLVSFDEWYASYQKLKQYPITDVLPPHDPNTYLKESYG